MTNEIVRSKRLRKKLHLDEFAILGFEFSCKINVDSEDDYDAFFSGFAQLVNSRGLFININGDQEMFDAFVTSDERYGNATEEDIAAIKTVLEADKIISDVVVGPLVDAFYDS